MSEELVSIVIPCYRGEQYLEQAIESCLCQTYGAIEVIVVDDRSPDRCAQIAKKYCQKDPRVRLIRRWRNGGVARAFNTGYRAARGMYFTRLAQDDVFRKNAVERMVEYLRAHPEVGLVYGDMLKIDEQGHPLDLYSTREPNKALTDGNRVGLWVMWRRQVWENLRGFDPLFDTIEDYEFFCRVAKLFPIARLEGEPGLEFRQHPQMGSIVYKSRQVLNDGFVRRLNAADQSPRSQAQVYWAVSWEFEEIGLTGLAVQCSWRAVRFHPSCWTYWRHLAGELARWAIHRCKKIIHKVP